MKNELRKLLLQKRKLISCKEKDIGIMQNLFSMKEFSLCKNILAYYPLKYEPDIKVCFTHHDKNWFLPRVNGVELDICEYNPSGLSLGSFNIMEPEGEKIKTCEKIDMVIAPAVAVDKKGYRLGYGKGFYDRLLPKLKQDCIKIFVVYDELIADTIYPESTDIKCGFIVTEQRVYKV